MLSDVLKARLKRGLLMTVEGIAVLFVLILLVFGGFVWRLNSGPLDVSFAKDYVLESLKNEKRGTYTGVGDIILHWPDLDGPLLLGMRDVEVFGPGDRPLFFVREVALSLSKAGLIIGEIAPTALILKNTALRVTRLEDGSFGFDLNEEAPSFQSSGGGESETIKRILSQVLSDDEDQNADSGALSSLEAIRISDARVVIDDKIAKATWDIPNLDIALERGIPGLASVFSFDFPVADGILSPHVEGKALYKKGEDAIEISAQIKDIDAAVLASQVPDFGPLRDQDVSFDVSLVSDVDMAFNLLSADVQITSDKGLIDLPQEYDAPIAYEDFSLKAYYKKDRSALAVPEVTVRIQDTEFKAQANVLYNVNDKTAKAQMTLGVDRLPQSMFEAYWPKSLRGDAAEKWLVHRLSEGVFHDISGVFDISGQGDGENYSVDIENIVAEFKFENMHVDYNAPMIPVSAAKGSGRYNHAQETLTVRVEEGKINDLELVHADLEFVNIIQEGQGMADVNVQTRGALPGFFEYVSRDPIALDHGFDVSAIQGQADMNVNINFPTRDDIKVEDVKVEARGTVKQTMIPDVVKTLDLTGGPFQVLIKDNQFLLSGKGALEKRPIDLNYMAFLEAEGEDYISEIKVRLRADEELRNTLGIDLSEFYAGPADVNVVYRELRGDKAHARVSADLKPGGLFVTPFGYKKPRGKPGKASVEAFLSKDDINKIIVKSLEADGFTLDKTEVLFRAGEKGQEVSYVDVSSFILGETAARADIEFEPSGRMKVVMDGNVFDLRPFLKGKEKPDNPEETPPVLLSVSADKMRASDDGVINYGKIYADIDAQGRFNQLEMDGAAGAGEIYLRYKPDDSGKRTFRFEADDAGATLRAFGLYDKIQGGKMIVYAEPVNSIYDRNLTGVAEILDFKVVNAPSLARLLSAMSLPGMLSLLGQDGIAFSKLEAKFDWLYRLEGSVLVLQDGRTSGNALGLTFDGTFDKARNFIDVGGTLVPMSGVNSMVANIPLLGAILSGGSDSVFAATYTMKGKAEKPEISVNPLSVLAPGILRRILFE